MSIRSPYPIRKIIKPNPTVTLLSSSDPSSTRDVVMGLHDIEALVAELKALKHRVEMDHAGIVASVVLEHQEKMREIDGHVAMAHQHLSTIRKGDKGDQGDKGDAIKGDKGDQGDAGLDAPLVDLKKVAKQAAKLIPVPKDGEPGKSVDPAAIIEAVVKEIVKGKHLKMEHVSGLPQELRLYRSQQMRGGGDTVAAGSGVTISSSGGVKTISATGGGGGFSILTATETPDGNLTVFTFAAATAQPSFVISDNVMMQATTKAGTVNWTWNNVAKQATLTVPPADELCAIA